MPNKKASIKHQRQTVRRTVRNNAIKKQIKDILKKGDKAIAGGSIKEKSAELMHALQKAVDKAIKVGIVKPNTGDRKKSRFAARIKRTLVK